MHELTFTRKPKGAHSVQLNSDRFVVREFPCWCGSGFTAFDNYLAIDLGGQTASEAIYVSGSDVSVIAGRKADATSLVVTMQAKNFSLLREEIAQQISGAFGVRHESSDYLDDGERTLEPTPNEAWVSEDAEWVSAVEEAFDAASDSSVREGQLFDQFGEVQSELKGRLHSVSQMLESLEAPKVKREAMEEIEDMNDSVSEGGGEDSMKNAATFGTAGCYTGSVGTAGSAGSGGPTSGASFGTATSAATFGTAGCYTGSVGTAGSAGSGGPTSGASFGTAGCATGCVGTAGSAGSSAPTSAATFGTAGCYTGSVGTSGSVGAGK